GVLATVLIVDLLNRRRAEQELKEQLLFELGSEDNSTALRALRLLKYKGWISNLEQIDLRKANLTGADLSNSSLIGANLSAINIADGNLRNTQLQRINLYFANLRDANLSGANLQAGELGRAILCGADLSDANMSGANLRYAGFDERTALPDSRIADVDTFNHRIIYDKYWTPDTDMTRYTDPNHPEFWQPEWVLNRGGDEAES
ncbi:MAG: pentapeptide repeat-containing protein, partial [Chloroflexota bacterium]